MKIELYQEQNWLFNGAEGICTKIAFKDADTRLHNHSYYEFFLVISGHAQHHVNNRKKIVAVGSLVLIRPNDVHRFAEPTADYIFYNLLIAKETMDTCLEFLGSGFHALDLKEQEMPPSVILHPADLVYLLQSFEHISVMHEINIPRFNALLRSFAANLLTNYFFTNDLGKSHDVPSWLNMLMLEMQQQKNYQEGLNALYRISQKSPEYLCRIFKKYLHKTPTQFINDIRITNAKLALEYTNQNVLQICNEVGFENTSHFYHIFKKETGMAPNSFRNILSDTKE